MVSIEYVTFRIIDHVRSGHKQVMFRIATKDLTVIDLAADAMAMSRAEFMRTAVINSARALLAGLHGKPLS
jgi:uncharacterized protein (DUF1778 family)